LEHWLRVVQEQPLQVGLEHLPQLGRLLLEHLLQLERQHRILLNHIQSNRSCCVSFCSEPSCSEPSCSGSACSRMSLFHRQIDHSWWLLLPCRRKRYGNSIFVWLPLPESSSTQRRWRAELDVAFQGVLIIERLSKPRFFQHHSQNPLRDAATRPLAVVLTIRNLP
jgi:hypothetical protein